MNQHTSVNQKFWDEIAPHHAASDFYAVEQFVAGGQTLGEIELAEVGAVTGKTMLHLQCHIGLDTLSWARRGAAIAGVDFSAESLRIARDLAARTGLDATFIESDVVAAPQKLGETYDIVFSSRGVLMWLDDLDGWAATCAALLRPGGVFYVLDIHPLAMAIERTDAGLALAQSYFAAHEPGIRSSDGSYAVQDVGLRNTETREWIHPVGDVVSALTGAGIVIDFLHEFPADALTTNMRDEPQLPALFSIRGHR
jgi:2-polyprenyl-3-methyl-5-hydroxy-6-metoxy-1,4-benzoquinol methylase